MTIVLIGGGKLAFQVAKILANCPIYSSKDIVSFCRHTGQNIRLPFPRVTSLPSSFDYVAAIGSPGYRELEVKYLTENVKSKSNALNIIDKSSIIADDASIIDKSGVIVLPGAIICSNASIGKFTLLGSGSIVEHDSTIGDFCNIGPGAVCCGETVINNKVLVGANATIIQKVTLGKSAVVGAGSVVIKNIKPRTVNVGNPSRMIRETTDKDAFKF